MSTLHTIYRTSLGLLTDLYELTMAYGYWKQGLARREAVFHLFFRSPPFGGGYAIAAGLAPAIEFLENLSFDRSDRDYLASLAGNDGRPLFEAEFLDLLGELRLQCDVDAVPEGTVVFPQEPLVRVQGPLLESQLLETALLNIFNFQTLIATKAARVVAAARGDDVLEFGLRRAQGIDGALAASRAAYLGGCVATSNVLAGKLFDIPVRGTHAHSWILCFDDELTAFRQYARAMPNNCVFLVDTYDTLSGVQHAIDAAKELRAQGHEIAGIRLDSGDLAYLSIEARRMLDKAGFPDAVIIASNDLDEHVIDSLKDQGARIGVWGVGTRLVTAEDQPALGGVYKLSAIRQPGQPWQYKVKVSEQAIKTSTPGILQVRRFFQETQGTKVFLSEAKNREAIGDMIYDVEQPPGGDCILVDPLDATRHKTMPAATPAKNLLVPVFRGGRRVYTPPSLEESRRHAQAQLAQFHPGVKRFVHPHQYPVGLEKGLHERKMEMISASRSSRVEGR
ncbi:MAG: nicotinate phosphoribosyltransferase [Pirellulales bacterium]|nr:nicotinate phosphoribosyltransferase [Pirellulales bacterium]